MSDRKASKKERASPGKGKVGKSSEIATHIEGLLSAIGKRIKLAAAIDVSESRISEWMAGKRIPSPETMIKLGNLELRWALPDPFFFWHLAGVDYQAFQLMADKVFKDRYEFAGETFPISRFRETEMGREEAGTPVLLPAEFIPSPRTTECLLVDGAATAVVDVPHGLVILETSVGSADSLHDLWGGVVVVRYMPPLGLQDQWPSGLYMGRLELRAQPGIPRDPNFAAVSAWLNLLSGRSIYKAIYLGKHIEPKGMEGVTIEDTEGWYRRMDEIKQRARLELSLIPESA